jgi:hypothetical protein
VRNSNWAIVASFVVIGCACIVTGAWLIYRPAGFLTAGAAFILLALLVAKGSAIK